MKGMRNEAEAAGQCLQCRATREGRDGTKKLRGRYQDFVPRRSITMRLSQALYSIVNLPELEACRVLDLSAYAPQPSKRICALQIFVLLCVVGGLYALVILEVDICIGINQGVHDSIRIPFRCQHQCR